MSTILEVKGVTKRYGGLVAVNNVSFSVQEGEILSVIGPNGAGKSTLFKLIASFVQTSAGEVRLRGERISDLAPHTVARKGVVRTFQETTIFRSMTVRENIIVAHHLRSRASLLGFFLGTGLAQADEALFAQSADDIVEFLGLHAIRDELASNLPQGHLRALGMAIGLATNPTVLDCGAQLWRKNRRGHPRRNPKQPQSHRGLPGRRRRCHRDVSHDSDA